MGKIKLDFGWFAEPGCHEAFCKCAECLRKPSPDGCQKIRLNSNKGLTGTSEEKMRKIREALR